jgi:hypothetical protein
VKNDRLVGQNIALGAQIHRAKGQVHINGFVTLHTSLYTPDLERDTKSDGGSSSSQQ